MDAAMLILDLEPFRQAQPVVAIRWQGGVRARQDAT
jgi:hypothetical protein